MKKHGKLLIKLFPETFTSCLLDFVKQADVTEFEQIIQGFSPVFLDEPDGYMAFLETLLSTSGSEFNGIFSILLELYLQKYSKNSLDNLYSEKAMKLIQGHSPQNGATHTLLLCRQYNFQAGLLYLYEKECLYREILELHIQKNNEAAIISTCLKYGEIDPSMWTRSLVYFSDKSSNRMQYLPEVINHCQNVLSQVELIEILSKNELIPFSLIKDSFLFNFKEISESIEKDKQKIAAAQDEIAKLDEEINDIKTNTRIFQSMKCTSCSGMLDLPAIHFFCRHSYHQRCLGEDEKTCPKCAPDLLLVQEKRKQRQLASIGHEQFMQQLKLSENSFQVIADFFGKNAFSEI